MSNCPDRRKGADHLLFLKRGVAQLRKEICAAQEGKKRGKADVA